MKIFEHEPHPHIEERKDDGVITVNSQRRNGGSGIRGRVQRFNNRVGLAITLAVGTMFCAYIFSIIALISLPSAISSGNVTVIIAWLSSNFLQLILLPVIIVGQNLQAAASDKRAEQTYKDAEAILSEALQIHEHLEAQDKVLADILGNKFTSIEAKLTQFIQAYESHVS